MKPIKFLDKELAKEIYKFSLETVYSNPIDALHFLKHIFDTTGGIAYFEEETAKKIHYIIENHPEQLLLHFATYKENNDGARFSTPINENVDLITYIRKDVDEDSIASSCYFVHKDSGMEFNATLIDTMQEESNDDIQFVGIYLYGDPQDEDWTKKEIVKFKDVEKAVQANLEYVGKATTDK